VKKESDKENRRHDRHNHQREHRLQGTNGRSPFFYRMTQDSEGSDSRWKSWNGTEEEVACRYQGNQHTDCTNESRKKSEDRTTQDHSNQCGSNPSSSPSRYQGKKDSHCGENKTDSGFSPSWSPFSPVSYRTNETTGCGQLKTNPGTPFENQGA